MTTLKRLQCQQKKRSLVYVYGLFAISVFLSGYTVLFSLFSSSTAVKDVAKIVYNQVLPSSSSSQHNNLDNSPENFGLKSSRQVSPIAWPQVADRIGRALLNGHKIIPNITFTDETKKEYTFNNTKYEAPIEHLTTVVTCMYEIRGKHSGSQYGEWFSNMLHATDPMVVIIGHDEDRNYGRKERSGIDWFELVRSRRQHAPTIIVRLPFQNLTTHTQFDGKFWELQAPGTTRLAPSYRVYNEKLLLMKEVAFQNPFHTEHFFWVDGGYFRGKAATGMVHGVIARNNISANGIAPGQVLFANMYGHPNNQEIAAGVWGGTKEAIFEANQKYWIAFWDSVTKGLQVGLEQRVLITMCRSWPDLCHMVYSGRDQDWFTLGRNWMRQTNFNFSTVYYKVSLDDFNASLAPKGNRHQLLPTTIVKDPVVFPEGIVTGESVSSYYSG